MSLPAFPGGAPGATDGTAAAALAQDAETRCAGPALIGAA